jgi:hypothetical protein
VSDAPERSHAQSAHGAPIGPDKPQFNPIFAQFYFDVPEAEKLRGLVAYGLYKIAKREWASDLWSGKAVALRRKNSPAMGGSGRPPKSRASAQKRKPSSPNMPTTSSRGRSRHREGCAQRKRLARARVRPPGKLCLHAHTHCCRPGLKVGRRRSARTGGKTRAAPLNAEQPGVDRLPPRSSLQISFKQVAA